MFIVLKFELILIIGSNNVLTEGARKVYRGRRVGQGWSNAREIWPSVLMPVSLMMMMMMIYNSRLPHIKHAYSFTMTSRSLFFFIREMIYLLCEQPLVHCTGNPPLSNGFLKLLIMETSLLLVLSQSTRSKHCTAKGRRYAI
jgi:hypothetical protein